MRVALDEIPERELRVCGGRPHPGGCRGAEAFKSHQITGFLDVSVRRRDRQASEV